MLILFMRSPAAPVPERGEKPCSVERQADGNYKIYLNKSLVYTTMHFDICASSGASLERIADARQDCVKFARLEDSFLELERSAVCAFRASDECEGVGSEMEALSKEIKAMFPSETFDYHGVHIEMGANCVGSAPSNNFTTEALCGTMRQKANE